MDRTKARALVLEARATGNLGDTAQAAALAPKRGMRGQLPKPRGKKPGGSSKQGRNAEAIECYADAFTIEDPRSTEEDRAQDRRRMGELYAKVNGSEKGLGDLMLRAYDRTSAVMSARLADLKANDPNAGASEILDFTLPPVNGSEPLQTRVSRRARPW